MEPIMIARHTGAANIVGNERGRNVVGRLSWLDSALCVLQQDCDIGTCTPFLCSSFVAEIVLFPDLKSGSFCYSKCSIDVNGYL
jgi:hypothetical protein